MQVGGNKGIIGWRQRGSRRLQAGARPAYNKGGKGPRQGSRQSTSGRTTPGVGRSLAGLSPAYNKGVRKGPRQTLRRQWAEPLAEHLWKEYGIASPDPRGLSPAYQGYRTPFSPTRDEVFSADFDVYFIGRKVGVNGEFGNQTKNLVINQEKAKNGAGANFERKQILEWK